MGYETRLYIVNTSDFGWAEVVGSFDLCKMDYYGPFHKALSNFPYFNGYIFLDGDGDKEVTEDRHGDKMRVFTVQEILELLEQEDKSYRRIQPAINFISSFLDEKVWPNLRILTFGH